MHNSQCTIHDARLGGEGDEGEGAAGGDTGMAGGEESTGVAA